MNKRIFHKQIISTTTPQTSTYLIVSDKIKETTIEGYKNFMINAYKRLEKTVAKHSKDIAFVVVDKKKKKHRVSYSAFLLDIKKAMTFISKNDAQKTTHIGIIARNSYYYLVWMYATIGTDNVFVPLNIEKSCDEITYESKKVKIDYLIHDGEFVSREPDFDLAMFNKVVYITDFKKTKKTKVHHQNKRSSLSMIIFTSGTTGISRGVSVSASNINENINAFSNHYKAIEKRIKEEIKYFSCLPFYHIYGLSNVMACINNGYTIGICTDIKYILRDLEKTECNCSSMVPTILSTIKRYLHKEDNKIFTNLKEIMVAGATSNTNDEKDFINSGINITHDYGLTEMAIVTINRSKNLYIKLNSIGKAFGNTKVKIKDGEILLKGKSLTAGYYNDAKSTKNSFVDGWFYTGDLGKKDKNGYIFLTGRKKNVIVLSSGENVNPEELESILLENNCIKEVLVKEENNKICAIVYCESGKVNEVKNCVNETNKKIASYKHISIVHTTNKPLNKTGSGKIRRY